MPIIRVNKTDNYTVMSNYHLRDKRLSLKSIGLLSKILSLPDNWGYSVKGLVAICKEQDKAVEAALKELKDNGYIILEKLMPDHTESGRIEYIYNIYEAPQGIKQDPQNGVVEQDPQKQGVEKQGVENGGLYKDTNKSNTDELNTDILSSSSVSQIIDAWNELPLNNIVKINPKTDRYKSLKARVDDYGIKTVLEAIAMIKKSSFLRGDNDRGWKITFDWLIKPNNFPKVLEGNYTDKEKNHDTHTGNTGSTGTGSERKKNYRGWSRT